MKLSLSNIGQPSTTISTAKRGKPSIDCNVKVTNDSNGMVLQCVQPTIDRVIPSAQIKLVEFGVMSDQEILKLGVNEINRTETDGDKSVYDQRLGTTQKGRKCAQCGSDTSACPGHFGYIKLNYPIMNPLFTREILLFLNYVCGSCFKPCVTESWLQVTRITSSNFLKKLESVKMCANCSKVKFFYSYDKKLDRFCINGPTKGLKIPVNVASLQKILTRISAKDIETVSRYLAVDGKVDPNNFIITYLPVAPLAIRADVDAGGRKKMDDITFKYIEILKVNKELENYSNVNEDESAAKKSCIDNLAFHIQTLFDNSANKSKQRERPITGIKPRLIGKNGAMRGNLMGKRVDYNGRSVNGGDVSLDVDEIMVPQAMTTSLTPRVAITSHNHRKIIEMIINGDAIKLMKRRSGSGSSGQYDKYILSLKINHLQHLSEQVLEHDVTIRRNGKELSPFKMNRYHRFELKEDDEIFLEARGPLWNVERQFLALVNRGKQKNEMRKEVNAFVKASQLLLQEKKLVFCDGEICTVFQKVDGKFKEMNEQKLQCKKGHCLHDQINYIVMNPGDYVERKLKEGDMLLFNRQPTLHRGSIIAMKVKPVDFGQTLRMNLAITASFNADYDGDEMNVHLITSEEGEAEMRVLSTIDRLLFNPQVGRSIIELKQDTLLAVHLLLHDFLEMSLFADCVMVIKREGVMEKLDRVLKSSERKENKISGKALISMTLPDSLHYHEKGIHITAGILESDIIGSLNGLLCHIHSAKEVIRFASDIQFVTARYLMSVGFSVGVGDCILPIPASGKKKLSKEDYNLMFHTNNSFPSGVTFETITNPVSDLINDEIKELDSLIDEDTLALSLYCPTTRDKKLVREAKREAHQYCESQINRHLNNIRGKAFLMVEKLMNKNNPIKVMKDSGAKGKADNISQIVGLIGQQNIGGMRIGHNDDVDIPFCQKANRVFSQYENAVTTIHYEKEEEKSFLMEKLNNGSLKRSVPISNKRDILFDYKRKGFICSSFTQGLDPLEFWEHTASGRDGNMMMETQVPNIGYYQRRCGKKMEDYKVITTNSRLVTDTVGNVVQFNYGGDGLDGASMYPKVADIIHELNHEN